MKKIELPVLLGRVVPPYPVSRILTMTLLGLALFAPLLAACGCHDVKGAAHGTAGQLSEREKRDKEAMEILDGGQKK